MPFKVAVYLYENADILDFSGPIEIYGTRPATEGVNFEITTFAHKNPINTETGALVYIPNAGFDEVASSIENYDILLIPGADFGALEDLIASEDGKALSSLIQKFSSLPPRGENGKRILQSVCTGAILLAASGILAGRTVTTHHMGFEMLQRVADQAACGDSRITIAKTRWVDAGTTDAGVRIVSAGGVSSGIDTSLWIYEQLVGKKEADWVAEVVEFERRGDGWRA